MTRLMFAKPLYRIVADQLEAGINDGRYPPGSLLPAEVMFEQEFGVSRITIRQAIGLLRRRGMLDARSGRGTFVRPKATERSAIRFTGSLRDLVYYAAATRYSPLGRALVAPPPQIAAELQAPDDAKVLCFTGKRGWNSADDFCLEQIYVPEALGAGIDHARIGKLPLLSQLEEIHRVRIAEAEQKITAVSATRAVARLLDVRLRAPLLKATRTYRLADGKVVEVAVSHYDPSRFEYVMNLYPE
jgi:GntR family transcriptional regulator